MKTSKITKRGKIRLISYILTLFVTLGIVAAAGAVNANSYERQITLSRQRALNEFGENVDGIRTDLSKCIYAGTAPMLSELSTSILQKSINAKTNLCQLPVSDVELDNTYRFLSQIGEYLIAINKKVANDEKITEEEYNQLLKFLDYSEKLSEQISVLTQGLNDQSLSFEDTQSTLSQIEDKETLSFSTAMMDTEESFVDYPTLIYDGPFSDHIINKEPKIIKDKDEISEEDARKIAAKFFSVEASSLKTVSAENSVLPCYCFQADTKTIGITKWGGYACYMLNSDYAGEAQINQETAVEKAKTFLSSNGYKDMKESYYSTYDGICVINFAQMQGGIICYADLIKVGVFMDTGEIASFDARGYLMNYTEREIISPSVSVAEAQNNLAESLTVMSERQCIIPLKSGNEAQCYEFHCKGADNDEVLVYIDCKTGNEAQILLLLYADGGVLTR